MSTLDDFAREELAALESATLKRQVATTRRLSDGRVERDAGALVSFCCNDYLGLTQRAEVKRRAIEAVEAYGAGAGAPPLVTGTHPLYSELSESLARFKGTQAAVVFGSGYLANIGIIPALTGPGDLILADELSHICLLSGSWLSRARFVRFPHNDVAALERLLLEARGVHRNCLIVTETVFSMDGDLAPLEEMAALARAHDAWLLADDAHGLGVLNGGRGGGFRADGSAIDIPLRMGTLSKAVGAYGGYLCASRPVIELVQNRARSFIYTTCLPPAVLAAALEGLRIIEAEPELCARPLALARRFTRALDLPEAQSLVVPLVLGDEGRALDAAKALATRGFLVTAMRPPTVPKGTSRLRFTFTALHSEDLVDRLTAAICELGLDRAARAA